MASGVYQPIHPQLLAGDRTVWGKYLWAQIHSRPDEIGDDLSHEDEWLQEFMEAIPCEHCKWHMWRYVQQTPPDLSCNGNYRLWIFWFHNQVNLKLGKPIFLWPKSWPPSPIKLRADIVEP